MAQAEYKSFEDFVANAELPSQTGLTVATAKLAGDADYGGEITRK